MAKKSKTKDAYDLFFPKDFEKSINLTIWVRAARNFDENISCSFLPRPVLAEDVKEGCLKGLKVLNSKFFYGEDDDNYIFLDYNNLSSENLNKLKTVKENEIIEIHGYFGFEFFVDEDIVNDEPNNYKLKCRFKHTPEEIIQFNIIKDSKIISKMNRLTLKNELKKLYKYRDIKYIENCGHSLIDTYAELLLMKVTPFDIGVFIECDIYKNRKGYITLGNIIKHNPSLEKEVKQSFNNLEGLGYLKQLNPNIVYKNEYNRPYYVNKSILNDDVLEANVHHVSRVLDDCNSSVGYERIIIQKIEELWGRKLFRGSIDSRDLYEDAQEIHEVVTDVSR